MSKTLSIVLPCFNEAENIQAVVEAFAKTGLAAEYELEIIFVDDGSSDDTWERICRAAQSTPWVKGIRLSRNFGQQAALLAGLRQARGDAVITMDSDLQHPPALVRKLLARWQGGAQLVTTIRTFTGREPFFKRTASRLFYWFFQFATGLPIVPGQADFRLFDRKVVDAILAIRESGMFLRGLVTWVGFRQEAVHYDAEPRHAGETKYTLRRMILLAIEGMFSFSNLPLRLGLVGGGFLVALALVYAAYAAVVRMLAPQALAAWAPAWASFGACQSFFFGLLFFYLGIMGEYLARVYLEAKGRPQYLIADTTEN